MFSLCYPSLYLLSLQFKSDFFFSLPVLMMGLQSEMLINFLLSFMVNDLLNALNVFCFDIRDQLFIGLYHLLVRNVSTSDSIWGSPSIADI